MPLPKYYEMHKPFLEYLSDGKEHKLKELKQYVSKQLRLTESQLAEMLPSGRQTVFDNRIGWARTYLKKAGLIESPSRAAFVITEEGAKVLEDNPEVIDVDYLMRYEKFQEFQGILNPSAEDKGKVIEENDETPDDIVFETAGNQVTASQTTKLVARGGKILIVGTLSQEVAIDFLSINREVKIQTVFRYANNFPMTIEAIASGRIDVKSMITDIYTYKEVQRAFEEAVSRKAEIIKSVIKIEDEEGDTDVSEY